MSEIGIPIYITETGVPDAQDVLRTEMFTTYFEQVDLLISLKLVQAFFNC